MALTKKNVSDIVSAYKGRDGKPGAGISALAAEHEVSPATIRYHLKQAGLLVAAPAASEPQWPAFETDKDLGIGEPIEAAPANELEAMLANPVLAKLIDAAVASRLAQMGAPVQSSATSQTEDFKAFTASLAHLIEVNAMQQAGYIKPLSAAEIDSRAAGLIELKSLLKDYEARGTAPEWIVGESGFFECTNALEFMPGQTIRTYLYPVEDFIPKNAEARKVHAAMIQWIGGHTPGIGEQVEAAMRAANQSAPLVTGTLNAMHGRPQPVELVNTPRQEVSRKRVAGSLVPERHDVSLADRAAGPAGPVFIGDRAA